jgi:excisionase family DNA binding protein
MKKKQAFTITPDELIARVVKELKQELSQAAVTQSYHSYQFLSRNEVAKLLKISISTVHNWTKRGILTPYHIGGRVYFKPSEIENSMFKINYCGYERF